MLTLAKPKTTDIFFDLGCGWAQNLIIAGMEFGLRCVGVERIRSRYDKAKRRIEARERRGELSPGQITIYNREFEDIIESGVDGIEFNQATIIFYGLSTSEELFESIAGKLKGDRKHRLIYYYNCLFPEINPTRVAHPFYLSEYPFVTPRSELEWLQRINREKDTQTSSADLWSEISHDYQLQGYTPKEVREMILDYKRRIRRTVRTQTN